MKKRVLFICETVTQAHLMRTSELIKGLDPNRFEVHLAAGTIPAHLAQTLTWICRIWPLRSSVPSAVFLKHLAKGTLPYTLSKIREQINEDLTLLETIEPEIVIGDFRLSLSISARVKKIKYINITNSTWHPQSGTEMQVPDLPIVRLVGEKFAKFVFKYLQPFIFRRLAKPFLLAAKEQHVEIPTDLNLIYVDGDIVFFADSSSVAPLSHLEIQHVLGGPILTSMQDDQQIIPTLNSQWPNVIVSLGSSGDRFLAPRIIEILSPLPINIFVATNSEVYQNIQASNVYCAPFLPLKDLFKKADLFINNGGSASGYLSLSMGVPFLAIPSNLDQFNFTSVVEKSGAALRLRIEEISEPALKAKVLKMLDDSSFRYCAEKISTEMKTEDSIRTFQKILS